MSDDRLFASNNAIGRKWYFFNLIILALIVAGTKYLFEVHIIPNVTTEVYSIIAKGFLYFAFLIYTITFFALIERRLYDAAGTRDSGFYKNVSSTLTLAILVVGLYIYCQCKQTSLPIPQEIMKISAYALGDIFIAITVILMFLKGKISNLTYEEYRKKIKYE